VTTADALIAAAEAAADELQTMATTNADLTAQNAELRAELEALSNHTVFGLNTTSWTQAGINAHRQMLDGAPLLNCRVFFSPGQAPTWDDPHLKLLGPADRPWVSCKTLTEATLRKFLDTMPAAYKVPGVVYGFTYQHEGEADMLAAKDPAAAIKGYLDTYAMIERVMADHTAGRYFQPWKILLRFTQAMDRKTGRRDSWPRFVGDQTTPVGMDCYWPREQKTYMPAADLFAKLLEIHDKTGLRVCVPELGGVTVDPGGTGRNDADGSKRAAAIADVVQFVKGTPIESVNWWCGTGSAGDHHLDPFPSNVAAWTGAMAGG
jgi:hypothetical protein